jgi:hypothetical protein
MPVSTVDIVNTALDYIGQKTLTSMDEADPLAEKARRLWPIALDDVLRAHFWKCAQARANLERLAERPAFGFKHYYQLPPDFVRLVRTEPGDAVISVEGNRLMTDEDKIAIAYVKRLTDPTLYDATLRQCLALKLAQMLSFGGTASTAMSQEMEARYRDKLREARGYDAMEGDGLYWPASSWANAKLRG